MITLSNIMRANAISCIGFGIVFFLLPEQIQSFLSINKPAPTLVFIVLGIALFVNGLHLIWASLQEKPSRLLVIYFCIGDYLWVIGSFYLLLTGLWITTPKGIAATLLVSIMVGTFGLLQTFKLKKMESS